MEIPEENHESKHRGLSHRIEGKVSELSPQSVKREKYQKDIEGLSGDRAQTRTRDPDQDRCSDGQRSSASFYSDDYENVSHSDQSLSPRTLSPSPHRRGRSRRVSSSPLHRAGVNKGVSRRPPPHSHNPQQQSRGLRSHSLSKEAPSKDVDPVTKRMLSARLLKINELKNALSELRLHADELQRENRLLRQLQMRQEKALHRYNDTESEISQLLSRHNNETHVLRERLRRSQENQRTAERSLRERDGQLQRCRNQLQKLQRLADDQNLGEREELSQKLLLAQSKLLESERRVKDLEKNMELNGGSFQRQLTNERRRTHDSQQEVKALQEEVERLCTKLKEKEKELDARNIYANRKLKAFSRKEADNVTSRKESKTTSTKAIQTEERLSSLDFPSPPPADLPHDDQTNDYLSLKDHQVREQKQKDAKDWKIQELWKEREKERELETAIMHKGQEEERETELKDKEKQRLDQQLSSHKKNSKGLREEFNREEEDWRTSLSKSRKDDKTNRQCELEEGEHKARNQEIHATNLERVEEERQRKEVLLAKMREIDMQTQGHDSDFFSDDAGSLRSPPRSSEQRKQNGIFNLTDTEETVTTSGSVRRGAGIRAQRQSEDLDLAFGSYAPSFGKPTPRTGLASRNTNQNSNPQQPRDLEEGINLGDVVKERKSNLMQQLFGSSATPPTAEASSKMEVLGSPVPGQFHSEAVSGRRRDTDTPTGLNIGSLPNKRSTLHVSESRPAVRAITSFDDDIEEVTL